MTQTQEFGWWLRILTSRPSYIYYFGVFDSYWELQRLKNGYIQDLVEEGSNIIDIQIERCQPEQLTISVMPVLNKQSNLYSEKIG